MKDKDESGNSEKEHWKGIGHFYACSGDCSFG